MTPQGATVIAILIIATTLIFLMSRFSKGRAQAKEDDLRKAATLRGWTFAKANDRGTAFTILSEDDRPWVLVRPQGVSLARMEQIRQIDELEQFINAGIGLTRAFRFGRPA